MMKGKSLLTIGDMSQEELEDVLALSDRLKARGAEADERPLEGKVVGILFEKSSTRTRVSFEVGVVQLGGAPLYLAARDLQWGRGEPIGDTARVLSRYIDFLVARTFAHSTLEELAEEGTIPVINALSDRFHPCQAIADLLTIREVAGKLQGVTLAYVGDGNNVCNSLLLAAGKVGMRIRVASPKGYAPDREVVSDAEEEAAKSGGQIRIFESPTEAVRGAEFVYTDVWASMGQEAERDQRVRDFEGYQVDEALLKDAAPEARVMHCLPAHRGEEVSAEVLDGPRAIVWDQAENRLHAQKAILARIA
ncbi:MAG: ornithine carbamoyltransferase [Planctomycetota bacterium]|nr:ornithine carbamoyltransferase [Planctomycetota bacterium]